MPNTTQLEKNKVLLREEYQNLKIKLVRAERNRYVQSLDNSKVVFGATVEVTDINNEKSLLIELLGYRRSRY